MVYHWFRFKTCWYHDNTTSDICRIVGNENLAKITFVVRMRDPDSVL